MSERWHIAVLIPARNEELLLERCLQSVLAARAQLPLGTTCDVVVASDLSTDRTAQIAGEVLGEHGTVLLCDVGCVGHARALAAQAALRRSAGTERVRCWLANTDADCEVPESWLVDQLQLAQRGYTAVAGIIDVNDFSDHQRIVESRFRSTYLIHADRTHPHVHGANLGVRADTYLLAGGWEPLHTAEDHDLWARLAAVSAIRLSDASLKVWTSGRRVGRAPAGFADALAAHNEPVSKAAKSAAPAGEEVAA